MKSPPSKTREGGPREEAAPKSRKAETTSSRPHPESKPLCHSDRFLERAEEATRQLISCWLFYGPKQVNECAPETMPGILPDVAVGVLDAMLNHGARDFADVYPHFNGAPPGILAELSECGSAIAPAPDRCQLLLEIIAKWHKAHRLDILANKLQKTLENGDDPADVVREITELEKETTSKGLANTLAARAFDFDNRPAKPIPLFRLCDMPLCTPGNITNIQALPKAGKSAVVESCIAAVMNGNRQGPDTLGFSAENPQGYALIHFDTEQSRFDHDALIRRACSRAQVERPPLWLVSYSVADLSIRERRQALRHAMSEASAQHGGIFAVLIDGIGDLCGDPNDSEESFGLVHELHALAIKHDCTIATVLHENPGSESGKTRGHLGSQLERKAETNLRMAKDSNGITTIWAERARHCYLPRDQGPCFSWNDSKQMHTSCGTAGEIKSAASREKMQYEAEAAFGDGESYRHGDLVKVIMDALHLKEKSAKERIRKWNSEGIIHKDSSGKYHHSTS